MPQNGGKPCDKRLSRTQKCKDLPPCPSDYNGANSQHTTSMQQTSSSSSSLSRPSNSNGHFNQRGSFPGALSRSNANRNGDAKSSLTSTTTSSSSMMDDEDDSKFSRLLKSDSDALQSASLTPTLLVVEDGHPVTTELELIGGSSFHIKDGYVFMDSINRTFARAL